MELEKEIIPQWETFVDTLRKELEEYGALFNLLDEQQRCICARESESLLALCEAIERQTLQCNQLRKQREQSISCMLDDWGIAREFASMASLIPLFPDTKQPLINALVEQINNNIARIRQKSRQNQLLLSRANEVIEHIIFTVQPQTVKTYNRKGNISLKANRTQGTRIRTSV